MEDYELEVHAAGPSVQGMTFTLDELKEFPKHRVVSTIQCGGNRRAEMHAAKPLKGHAWTGGAIGNAEWAGARLYDVLKAAGYKVSYSFVGWGGQNQIVNGLPIAKVLKQDKERRDLHIQFEGYDLGADSSPYGASIPIDKGYLLLL